MRNRSFKKKKSDTNQVRIIAGQWRSRKISFSTSKGLRPTSDRRRETLFNWLNPVIDNATCLDVFAGSGALGFEALSRGARQLVMLEKDKAAAQTLKHNQVLLDAKNCDIINQDALHYLASKQPMKHPAFDIVFLDPPFYSNLLPQTIDLLVKNNWIKPLSYIYLEQESTLDEATIALLTNDAGWHLQKSKSSGQVWSGLYQVVEAK